MQIPVFTNNDPNQQWDRYCELLWHNKDLDIWLDISRMHFASDDLDLLIPRLKEAFAAQTRLEAGSIANAKLSNSKIVVTDGSTASDIDLGNTLTFSGTSSEVTVSQAGGTVQIGLPDDVTIAGDLTVSGDTVTTNVATVTVEDPLVQYASNNAGQLVDIGFYGKYVESATTKYLGLSYDADQAEYILYHGNQAAPTTTVSKAGTGFAFADLRMGSLQAATVDGGSY